jgi:hypothetical protein
MPAKKNHDRSPDQTMMGVSMSKELKNLIKRAADRENRTMANYAVHYLKAAVEESERNARITELNIPPPR